MELSQPNERLWNAIRSATPSSVLAASAATQDSTRHRCFISRHTADDDPVAEFIETFAASCFIPRILGLDTSGNAVEPSSDEWIDSEDDDYVMSEIRSRYMKTTTLTICLIGPCTHTRKWVDWELASSLRKTPNTEPGRNAIVAIRLPGSDGAQLPKRIKDNIPTVSPPCDGCPKMARVYPYPTSEAQLTGWLDNGFELRNRGTPASPADPLKDSDEPC